MELCFFALDSFLSVNKFLFGAMLCFFSIDSSLVRAIFHFTWDLLWWSRVYFQMTALLMESYVFSIVSSLFALCFFWIDSSLGGTPSFQLIASLVELCILSFDSSLGRVMFSSYQQFPYRSHVSIQLTVLLLEPYFFSIDSTLVGAML